MTLRVSRQDGDWDACVSKARKGNAGIRRTRRGPNTSPRIVTGRASALGGEVFGPLLFLLIPFFPLHSFQVCGPGLPKDGYTAKFIPVILRVAGARVPWTCPHVGTSGLAGLRKVWEEDNKQSEKRRK